MKTLQMVGISRKGEKRFTVHALNPAGESHDKDKAEIQPEQRLHSGSTGRVPGERRRDNRH